MKRKKPDLILVLAMFIGMGVLLTEISYGQVFDVQAEKSVSTR